MRFNDVGEVIPQLLRNEIKDALGLEIAPAVHYDPVERWVEVDLDDPRVPSLVAGHAPDRRKMLPPARRELVDLIDQKESGTLPPSKASQLDRLLLQYVKETILP